MRILIAEDEVTIARVLKVMLEKNKYAVDMVHNGSDALDYIQAVGYDALDYIQAVGYDALVLDMKAAISIWLARRRTKRWCCSSTPSGRYRPCGRCCGSRWPSLPRALW